MRPASRAAVVACLLGMIGIACGGSTTSIPDGTSGASSGSSSGASSGASSSSSSGSTSGGTTCVPNVVNGDRACVPGLAKAGEPIDIEIDATEGCLGCFTKIDGCNVSQSGSTITVQMKATTCTPPGDVACPAVCGRASTKCRIPALAAGSYTVKVTGDKANGPTRTLVVKSGTAGNNRCDLPDQGQSPPSLDGAKYSKSCSGPGDCKAVGTGNLCQPCFPCPNVAIGKSSWDQYDADVRAITSQCTNTGNGPVCGACRQPNVECAIEPSALTGTCKILPF